MYNVTYSIEANTLTRLVGVLLSVYLQNRIAPKTIKTDLGTLAWNQPMATMLVRGEITEKEYIQHNLVA